MPQNNAIQQVFNPATQRTLIRIGLMLVIGLVLVLAVVLSIRLFKKTATSTSPGNDGDSGGNGGGTPTNNDGTPTTTLPQNLKRLADDMKQASSWTLLCNSLRCDTLLAIAELPDAQLKEMGAYYKSMYGSTLRETFDSFYISGCCFRDAGNVVDAKLKNIQQRVKNLNV